MVPSGLFTTTDLATIFRAASVAENLTGAFFDLANDEWTRNPYGVFTRKEVDSTLYREDAFAQVVLCSARRPAAGKVPLEEGFAIVLQDPTILRALLRAGSPDLWTLILFVLTHELVHIVRFRKFRIDCLAPHSETEREKEEQLVHSLTRKILAGVTNTDLLLNRYESYMNAAWSVA
ncbi:MAG: hypothetical protein FJ118_10135 [Deltaproteobacteria bacterium]|nr:hypothetical protein [Deltaproteobacteria bacterium]